MFRQTPSCFAMATTHNASAKTSAFSKLKAFRQIVQSRVSARRFEPNIAVPDDVWRDVLQMTLVNIYCSMSLNEKILVYNIVFTIPIILILHHRFQLMIMQQTSPSGFNLQPTLMLLLRSPQIKSTLSTHAMLGFGNQYRTKDASAIAVFCADLEPSKRIERIFALERESGTREDGYLAVLRVASSFLTGESSTLSSYYAGGASTHLSTSLKRAFTSALSPVQPMPTMENVESWSYKNAGIMAQMYTMSATAHGLSTCMMEGFDGRRAKEILRIPDRYGIPLMVATGYDYGALPAVHADLQEESDFVIKDDGVEKNSSTPRLEMNEVFFGDTFGEPLDLLHPFVQLQGRVGEEVA
jgi:nitroreductase